MQPIERDTGVRLLLPDDLEVVRRPPATRGARAVGTTSEGDRVAAALAGAGFEIVDRVELARGAAPPGATRARKQPLRVEVPVAASQSAVLLVEQDGMYSFALPSAKPRATTRSARASTVVFEVTLDERARPRTQATRGKLIESVWGQVRTYVLRFAADALIEHGVAYLERDVRPGFVDMRAKDPARWAHVDKLDDVALPADRPARILLFVHGTFSSTVGGFAALCGSPWGIGLLDAARARYDAIVGFDHPTLSVDPRVNAEALYLALAQRNWPHPPAIDIVAHSRGGLVARSLIEDLLPASKLATNIGKVVFVACTHEGTLLARPGNWKDLSDLYTNLVVAGCRVLEWFGYAKVASMVVEEVAKSLGLLVKLLAASAVTDKRAPGLAAMEPGGKFVKAINKLAPSAAQYYVVESDFATKLLGREGPDEFSQRFKLWLADGLVDKLMKKAANDLVVDTRSMTAHDVAMGKAVKGLYDFGSNALVYHTNYFTRPETVQAIGGWLGVLPPLSPRVTRSARKLGGGKRLPTTGELAKQAQTARTAKTARKRSPFEEMRSFAPAPERAAKKETATGACHFHAAMRDAVVVNTNAEVGVTIAREAIAKALGATAAGAAATVDLAQQLRIRVIPKQNFRVVGEDARDVDPPAAKKPIALSFTVCATDLGDGEVWVSVQQAQTVLVTLKLFPKIVRALAARPRKKSAKAAATLAPDDAGPINQLMIEELVNGEEVRYHFTFLSERLEVRTSCTSQPIRGDRAQYVAKLYKDIEERWLSSKRDAANFAKDLRAFGGELFDELVPAPLQQVLWDRRDEIKAIQVVSTEPFIPWELVHLKEPAKAGMPAQSRFLGEMGLIRWVQGVGNNGWPVKTIRVRDGKVFRVVPDYPLEDMRLPAAAAEAKFLDDMFAAKELRAESGAVRDFIAKPGRFDLLHFICHGEADSSSIADARLLMTGRVERSDGRQTYVEDPFTAKVASQYCNIGDQRNAPMVVLNACQVGRRGIRLTSIGGFSEAFLKGGAGAFVGTLWSVGDAPATTFTTELYTQLLARKTLCEATIAGREAARRNGDATWLAYVVYGHPYMKLDR
jgi:hypothetical protein